MWGYQIMHLVFWRTPYFGHMVKFVPMVFYLSRPMDDVIFGHLIFHVFGPLDLVYGPSSLKNDKFTFVLPVGAS